MGDTAVTKAEPEPNPSKSFAARCVGVFWSPGETFADIARKPDFIAPLIVLTVASLAFVETMLMRIGVDRVLRLSLQQGGQAAKMTPEQVQQTIQRTGTIVGIVWQAAGALGPTIYLLVVAAFGLLVVNAIFGERTPFKRIFSVTCYASLPSVLGSIMSIAVMFFGDPEHFNPASPAPYSLGFFLDPATTSKALYSLANSLDIFVIWFLVLNAIGLSAATGRRVKTISIALIFFGVWLLLILSKAGVALVMS